MIYMYGIEHKKKKNCTKKGRKNKGYSVYYDLVFSDQFPSHAPSGSTIFGYDFPCPLPKKIFVEKSPDVSSSQETME